MKEEKLKGLKMKRE